MKTSSPSSLPSTPGLKCHPSSSAMSLAVSSPLAAAAAMGRPSTANTIVQNALSTDSRFSRRSRKDSYSSSGPSIISSPFDVKLPSVDRIGPLIPLHKSPSALSLTAEQHAWPRRPSTAMSRVSIATVRSPAFSSNLSSAERPSTPSSSASRKSRLQMFRFSKRLGTEKLDKDHPYSYGADRSSSRNSSCTSVCTSPSADSLLSMNSPRSVLETNQRSQNAEQQQQQRQRQTSSSRPSKSSSFFSFLSTSSVVSSTSEKETRENDGNAKAAFVDDTFVRPPSPSLSPTSPTSSFKSKMKSATKSIRRPHSYSRQASTSLQSHPPTSDACEHEGIEGSRRSGLMALENESPSLPPPLPPKVKRPSTAPDTATVPNIEKAILAEAAKAVEKRALRRMKLTSLEGSNASTREELPLRTAADDQKDTSMNSEDEGVVVDETEPKESRGGFTDTADPQNELIKKKATFSIVPAYLPTFEILERGFDELESSLRQKDSQLEEEGRPASIRARRDSDGIEEDMTDHQGAGQFDKADRLQAGQRQHDQILNPTTSPVPRLTHTKNNAQPAQSLPKLSKNIPRGAASSDTKGSGCASNPLLQLLCDQDVPALGSMRKMRDEAPQTEPGPRFSRFVTADDALRQRQKNGFLPYSLPGKGAASLKREGSHSSHAGPMLKSRFSVSDCGSSQGVDDTEEKKQGEEEDGYDGPGYAEKSGAYNVTRHRFEVAGVSLKTSEEPDVGPTVVLDLRMIVETCGGWTKRVFAGSTELKPNDVAAIVASVLPLNAANTPVPTTLARSTSAATADRSSSHEHHAKTRDSCISNATTGSVGLRPLILSARRSDSLRRSPAVALKDFPRKGSMSAPPDSTLQMHKNQLGISSSANSSSSNSVSREDAMQSKPLPVLPTRTGKDHGPSRRSLSSSFAMSYRATYDFTTYRH